MENPLVRTRKIGIIDMAFTMTILENNWMNSRNYLGPFSMDYLLSQQEMLNENNLSFRPLININQELRNMNHMVSPMVTAYIEKTIRENQITFDKETLQEDGKTTSITYSQENELSNYYFNSLFEQKLEVSHIKNNSKIESSLESISKNYFNKMKRQIVIRKQLNEIENNYISNSETAIQREMNFINMNSAFFSKIFRSQKKIEEKSESNFGNSLLVKSVSYTEDQAFQLNKSGVLLTNKFLRNLTQLTYMNQQDKNIFVMDQKDPRDKKVPFTEKKLSDEAYENLRQDTRASNVFNQRATTKNTEIHGEEKSFRSQWVTNKMDLFFTDKFSDFKNVNVDMHKQYEKIMDNSRENIAYETLNFNEIDNLTNLTTQIENESKRFEWYRVLEKNMSFISLLETWKDIDQSQVYNNSVSSNVVEANNVDEKSSMHMDHTDVFEELSSSQWHLYSSDYQTVSTPITEKKDFISEYVTLSSDLLNKIYSISSDALSKYTVNYSKLIQKNMSMHYRTEQVNDSRRNIDLFRRDHRVLNQCTYLLDTFYHQVRLLKEESLSKKLTNFIENQNHYYMENIRMSTDYDEIVNYIKETTKVFTEIMDTSKISNSVKQIMINNISALSSHTKATTNFTSWLTDKPDKAEKSRAIDPEISKSINQFFTENSKKNIWEEYRKKNFLNTSMMHHKNILSLAYEKIYSSRVAYRTNTSIKQSYSELYSNSAVSILNKMSNLYGDSKVEQWNENAKHTISNNFKRYFNQPLFFTNDLKAQHQYNNSYESNPIVSKGGDGHRLHILNATETTSSESIFSNHLTNKRQLTLLQDKSNTSFYDQMIKENVNHAQHLGNRIFYDDTVINHGNVHESYHAFISNKYNNFSNFTSRLVEQIGAVNKNATLNAKTEIKSLSVTNKLEQTIENLSVQENTTEMSFENRVIKQKLSELTTIDYKVDHTENIENMRNEIQVENEKIKAYVEAQVNSIEIPTVEPRQFTKLKQEISDDIFKKLRVENRRRGN